VGGVRPPLSVMPSAPASPGNVPVSILVSIGTLVGGLYGFRYVREYREKQEVRWRRSADGAWLPCPAHFALPACLVPCLNACIVARRADAQDARGAGGAFTADQGRARAPRSGHAIAQGRTVRGAFFRHLTDTHCTIRTLHCVQTAPSCVQPSPIQVLPPLPFRSLQSVGQRRRACCLWYVCMPPRRRQKGERAHPPPNAACRPCLSVALPGDN